ncbi:hypothetical protein MED121_16259 [Marinomonas sp. MED121]|uniref:AhpA/YtjB family protein n=1 Tax=Marinomonas sp. MED121 TaxID=314277 RepID=UPI0000690FD7|nr:AhpA/YtjB family protein [Marinomonas sp. MED121]EAQ67497.1 hypothetical protein MED121_16259 [Marinomonas sp. MED121]
MDIKLKARNLHSLIEQKLSASIVTLLTFLSLMLITLALFWVTITNTLESYLTQQTEVLGSSLATQAAFNATQSILTNDLLSLNVLLTRLVVDENILSARVFNKQDELLAEASSDNSSYLNDSNISAVENKRVFSSSVKFRQEVVGHVIITLDKTPTQNILSRLNSLLISVSIFITALSLLIVFLVTRKLVAPITNVSEALEALLKGHTDAKLNKAIYKEANTLVTLLAKVQSLDWLTKTESSSAASLLEIEANTNQAHEKKEQIEINFEKIFEEDKQRSCVLYIELTNMEQWQETFTPIKIANLFTPVYRAMFQASEAYFGQVHQYQENATLILFSADECEDQLYLNAICTAKLFTNLIEKLLSTDIYANTPSIEYKIVVDDGLKNLANRMEQEDDLPHELEAKLSKIKMLSDQIDIKSTAISEAIFVLPEIQNKVFTGLPEIHTDEAGNETLSYSIKGMSDKLLNKIKSKFEMISEQI